MTFKQKQLIIMRGLPGSGKSTRAKTLVKNGIIYSTDNYFIDANGNYIFDESKVYEYHLKNIDATLESMKNGITPIIIDNINTIAKHTLPYVINAKYFKYEIIIEESDLFDFEKCYKLNKHNVSKENLLSMIAEYEPIDVFKRKLGLV